MAALPIPVKNGPAVDEQDDAEDAAADDVVNEADDELTNVAEVEAEDEGTDGTEADDVVVEVIECDALEEEDEDDEEQAMATAELFCGVQAAEAFEDMEGECEAEDIDEAVLLPPVLPPDKRCWAGG